MVKPLHPLVYQWSANGQGASSLSREREITFMLVEDY